ncbi:MAG: Asp-tRNA(Asn)/Glu-tRNA(Gln) amidotransferase subunit GatA [Planctomycetota bacterium]|jgi:aspartyl-tRNA(Asn)/glutamyl-tRNA(Gln) amidotransferase subunit A|nr:Asp-tRNA(Asn)/Glu-tRNA(Gln) amidotransferase subunit GatA [Planctomycetota bacterium]
MSITPEQFASLDLAATQAGLAAGDFTSEDLLTASLARIQVSEPRVNAILTRDPEGALAVARQADRQAKPDPRPLAGIPVVVKDNLMTRGVRTTCGSKILENFIPPYDAGAVEKLRAAGAVIVGKANMDEFAMGSTGENSAYGPTRNPWNPDRVTGGSSSGSAAVVAYGGVAAALGSDTGGSIRQPASFCGLVGLKPTYGRVSRWGLGALASSLDQIGPLTRTVRDNALVYDVIAGHDPRDSTSSPEPFQPCLAKVPDGVRGLRVGFDPSIFNRDGLDPVTGQTLRQALDVAAQAGAELVERELPLIDYCVAAYYVICACEASANLTRYDGVRYGVRAAGDNLWDSFAHTRGSGFGDEVKRRIMMGSFALSSGYYDAYYLKASQVRHLLVDAFSGLLREVDVFLLPVTPAPARLLGTAATPLENYLGDIFTLSANLTGLPALAFPAGATAGLPVGVQAMAGYFREDLLYRLAAVVEQALPVTGLVPEGCPWQRPALEASA